MVVAPSRQIWQSILIRVRLLRVDVSNRGAAGKPQSRIEYRRAIAQYGPGDDAATYRLGDCRTDTRTCALCPTIPAWLGCIQRQASCAGR